MKNKKALIAMFCAALLVAGVAFGTLAYLTDTEQVKNTFTVGQVHIDLNETDVDEDENTKANTYYLLPGHTYTKDPTVTIKDGSDDAYIRMIVKVEDVDSLRSAFPDAGYYYNGVNTGMFLLQKLCTGWDSSKWVMTDYEEYEETLKAGGGPEHGERVVNVGAYEFRYYQTISNHTGDDITIPALFTNIVVPEELNNEEIAHLNNVNIVVVAHAIQAAGFENADEAWEAFDAQHAA